MNIEQNGTNDKPPTHIAQNDTETGIQQRLINVTTQRCVQEKIPMEVYDLQ